MRIPANLVILVFFLGASLLLGEWLSRIQFGHPNPLPMDPHGERSFTSRPLSRGTFPVRLDESRYDYVPYQTSTLGLRDREYLTKRAGDVRVALLGDSMTMGWGLSIHETVARQVELMLSAANSTGKVQVINGGQIGYGPIQELSLLQEAIGPLEPDVIVLELFMGNDVADSARAGGGRLRSHNLEALMTDQLMARDSHPCFRANRWIRENSRAYQILAGALENAAPICSWHRLNGSQSTMAISPNEPRPPWLEVNLRLWYPELEKSWKLTKEGIRGIRRYCDEHGIELFVYVLPGLSDLSPERFRGAVSYSADPEAYEYGKGVRLAEEFLQEEGLVSIDVEIPILAGGDPEHAFYLWDGHLTPKGAKEVARAISRRLRGTSKVFDKDQLSTPTGRVSDSPRKRIEVDRVVLVTLDTLRADHLGAYGYPRNTSPFLGIIARRSSVFDHAVASSALTVPSHATILTGLHPRQHGVISNQGVLDDDFFTLAEVLSTAGFQTFGAISARHIAVSNLGQGFETFLIPPSGEGRVYRPAEETVTSALEEIERHSKERRQFYWFHLFDPHTPYQRHDLLNYFSESSGEPTNQHLDFLLAEHAAQVAVYNNQWGLLSAVDQYDDEVRYMDSQIARLYLAFERLGLNRRSLWVITADHGEGLGSHGIRGHERAIYNEQVLVPLIIHLPDRADEVRPTKAIAAHIDLVPTILEYVGVPTAAIPDDHKPYGQSLRRRKDDARSPPRFAVSELAAVSGRTAGAVAIQGQEFKYIRWDDRPDEFFNIKIDSCEVDNRIGDPGYSELARGMLEELSRWEAKVQRIIPEPIVVRGTDAELLRSLGYVD